MSAVTVKPLKWSDWKTPPFPHVDYCRAKTGFPGFRYAVTQIKPGAPFSAKNNYGESYGEYSTLEEAKAAIQAEFEQRILATLQEASQ